MLASLFNVRFQHYYFLRQPSSCIQTAVITTLNQSLFITMIHVTQRNRYGFDLNLVQKSCFSESDPSDGISATSSLSKTVVVVPHWSRNVSNHAIICD